MDSQSYCEAAVEVTEFRETCQDWINIQLKRIEEAESAQAGDAEEDDKI